MYSVFVDGMMIGTCNNTNEGLALGRNYCFNVIGWRNGQKIEVRDKNGIPKGTAYAS